MAGNESPVINSKNKGNAEAAARLPSPLGHLLEEKEDQTCPAGWSPASHTAFPRHSWRHHEELWGSSGLCWPLLWRCLGLVLWCSPGLEGGRTRQQGISLALQQQPNLLLPSFLQGTTMELLSPKSL